MASVKSVSIDSGIDPLRVLKFVPRQQWRDLVNARKWYIFNEFTRDCSKLVEWVREAEEMWQTLGYASLEDMIRHGYDLEPEEIGLAVRWLELNRPKEPVGLPEAIEMGRQQKAAMEAAAETRAAMEAAGGTNLTVYKNEKHTPLPKGTSKERRIARFQRGDDNAISPTTCCPDNVGRCQPAARLAGRTGQGPRVPGRR